MNDAPPSAIVSDASLIARYTDGCVYVVRQDYAGIDSLREGMEMFSGTGCKLLGCVLNHAEAGGSGYGYGYGSTEQDNEESSKKIVEE